MKHKAGIVFAILITLAALPLVSAAQDVAFVNVNVVPMDRERVLPNQTVVVHDGRIAALGPADQVSVPAGAVRIEGRGKYLMPGLTEMHAHIPDGRVSPKMAQDVLTLFLANGVTTLRGVLGFPGQLALRDQANQGKLFAPNMYLAGPGFSGGYTSGVNVSSPEQAVRMVREQKAEGWNLLKILPGLSLPVYDAVAVTARESGIRFVGHVPADVGLIHALDMGQETIEHMDGYLEYLHGTKAPVSDAQLREVVRKTREAGAWVVPTMVHRETVIGVLNLQAALKYPELQYMPPKLVKEWVDWYHKQFDKPEFDHAAARQAVANRMRLLKALQDGEGKILLGTDSTQRFNIPGFSIHREMKKMVAAGLTPYEVLKTGTQNAGIYFRNEDNFGTIAVGKRADLILVDDNPLDDVANVARRSGVMVRGTWFPESDLQARLERIADSYK